MTHMEVNFLETDSREFGLFLDGLRIERNISREDLCEGIMSLSQYKRYLRGDTAIPNDRLVLIADKLKFSISDIHVMYNRKSDKQLQKISDIYHLIQRHQFEKAYQCANELRDQIIVSDYNKLYYDFCMLNIQHNLNMVSDVHVLELYSEMIDYQNFTNRESMNWVEFNILIQIVKIASKMDNFEPADMLYSMISSERFTLNFNRQETYIPAIYITLAQILGVQDKYQQVIDITTKGINHCIKYEIMSSLAHLFLVNAFANYDLGNKEQAIESAKKVFMLLTIENKPQKFEQFRYSFENKFNMSVDDLICL